MSAQMINTTLARAVKLQIAHGIPWKLIAEDQKVVTRLLEDRFGRSAVEAKS